MPQNITLFELVGLTAFLTDANSIGVAKNSDTARIVSQIIPMLEKDGFIQAVPADNGKVYYWTTAEGTRLTHKFEVICPEGVSNKNLSDTQTLYDLLHEITIATYSLTMTKTSLWGYFDKECNELRQQLNSRNLN